MSSEWGITDCHGALMSGTVRRTRREAIAVATGDATARSNAWRWFRRNGCRCRRVVVAVAIVQEGTGDG